MLNLGIWRIQWQIPRKIHKEYSEVNDVESVDTKKKKINKGVNKIQGCRYWNHRFKQPEIVPTDLNKEPQESWEEVKQIS